MNVHCVMRYYGGAWVLCHSASGRSFAIYTDADAACARMTELATAFPDQRYAVHETPVL